MRIPSADYARQESGMYLKLHAETSVDVIIKYYSNYSFQISFAVSSQVDSRTILDMSELSCWEKEDNVVHLVGASSRGECRSAVGKEVERVVDFKRTQYSRI